MKARTYQVKPGCCAFLLVGACKYLVERWGTDENGQDYFDSIDGFRIITDCPCILHVPMIGKTFDIDGHIQDLTPPEEPLVSLQ